MRRIFDLMMLIATVAMCGFLSSCSDSDPGYEDDNIIWDFTPVHVIFEIVDNQENDLIATDGKLYKADFSIHYSNKTFHSQWTNPWNEDWDKNWDEDLQTKAYWARLYGLYYRAEEDGEPAQLVFAELDGDLGEADIILEMPDGTQHDLHISRRITTKGPEAFVKQKVTFDGKVIDSLTDGSPYMVIKIIV